MVTMAVDGVDSSAILTDDEIVAVAVESGTAWLLPLPTLDVSAEGALMSAAQRGLRSLALRGGYAEDGSLREGFASLGAAMGSSHSLVLFRGNDAGETTSTQIAYAVLPFAGGALLDSISGLGTHVLTEAEGWPAVTAFLGEILGRTHAEGLDDADGRMCLALTAADGSATILAVGPGTAGVFSVAADGVRGDRRRVDDIAAELEQMVAALTA